jgi:hypothetical protein
MDGGKAQIRKQRGRPEKIVEIHPYINKFLYIFPVEFQYFLCKQITKLHF